MVEVQTGLGGRDWVSGANLELDRDRRGVLGSGLGVAVGVS
jgi:hypothetical protein